MSFNWPYYELKIVPVKRLRIALHIYPFMYRRTWMCMNKRPPTSINTDNIEKRYLIFIRRIGTVKKEDMWVDLEVGERARMGKNNS